MRVSSPVAAVTAEADAMAQFEAATGTACPPDPAQRAVHHLHHLAPGLALDAAGDGRGVVVLVAVDREAEVGAGLAHGDDLGVATPLPALIDGDAVVFDSNAILLYLGEKTGKFLPADLRKKWQVMQWLMFQMGHIGPMLGQAHHFRIYAPEKIEYAINRFAMEAKRLLDVLNRRLQLVTMRAQEKTRLATVPAVARKDIEQHIAWLDKRIAKLDAPDKASGKTRYIQDLEVPGALHGKILRSTQVHARIVSIDTSAARALPGVHAVITAADVPWQRPIGVAKDHLPLKTDRVRSLRDEIAAVAADSEAIAEAALKLIRVEYAPLPVVATAEAALAPGAPQVNPTYGNVLSHTKIRRGDVDAALAKGQNRQAQAAFLKLLALGKDCLFAFSKKPLTLATNFGTLTLERHTRSDAATPSEPPAA